MNTESYIPEGFSFGIDVLPPKATIVVDFDLIDHVPLVRFHAMIEEGPSFGWTDWQRADLGKIDLVWGELIELRDHR